MVAIDRLADVTLELNLKEYTSCTSQPSANKAAHSGFKKTLRERVD